MSGVYENRERERERERGEDSSADLHLIDDHGLGVT